MTYRSPFNYREEADPGVRFGVKTFHLHAEAEIAARLLRGWEARCQFVRTWGCWVVEARRKTWPAGKVKMLLVNGTVG